MTLLRPPKPETARWPQTCNLCGAPLMSGRCPRCNYHRPKEGHPSWAGGGAGGALVGPVRSFVGSATALASASLSVGSVSFLKGDRILLYGATTDSLYDGSSSVPDFGGLNFTTLQNVLASIPVGFQTGLIACTDVATASGTVTVSVDWGPAVAAAAILVTRWSASGGTNPLNSALGLTGPFTSNASNFQVLSAPSSVGYCLISTSGPSDPAGTWDAPLVDGNRASVSDGTFAASLHDAAVVYGSNGYKNTSIRGLSSTYGGIETVEIPNP